MENRRTVYLRLLVELLAAAAAVGCFALFGGRLLGILMPFLLALIMAWAFNPVIQVLQKHLRLTRKLFSYLLVLIFYALFFLLCFAFAEQVVTQVIGLAKSVPTIVAQLQNLYNRIIVYVQELLELLPEEYDSLRLEILNWLSLAWDWLRSLISGALGSAVGITSNIALEVPGFVIFLTVLVLASCIITADFPNLRENIYGYLGAKGQHSLRLMGHSFRTAVLGFFRSQLIFALVDMAIILTAFFIIGVPYPLPIALVLAFLDFIPFFGAGTVLVPWGVACFVLGFFRMGAQLLALYAVLYILRRIFEPRVLGGSTGFSSLQMLFSMYAGMQLYGVTGLIVAPILWITAVNFLRTGIFDGFFADIRFVVADIRLAIARPVPTRTHDPFDTLEKPKKPENSRLRSLLRRKKRED